MLGRTLATVVFLTCLEVTAGCGGRGRAIAHPLTGRTDVYTLVNLRPDETRRWLSTVNYQREGLIPICTPVRIDQVGAKRVYLTVLTTGREYTMEVHKTLMMPIEAHIDRTFGTRCPKDLIESLGPLDREGVRSGSVSLGMTRQGVLLAMGHPPDHANPDLNGREWRYWINRFKTMLVIFDGDIVKGLRK